MLRASCGRGTADWFGVSKDSDSTQKWQRKSIRHCSQRYGKLKPQVMRELDLPSQDNVSLTSTETPPPLYVGPCQLGMQKVCPSTAASRQPFARLLGLGLCAQCNRGDPSELLAGQGAQTVPAGHLGYPLGTGNQARGQGPGIVPWGPSLGVRPSWDEQQGAGTLGEDGDPLGFLRSHPGTH